ncbi:MAG TPA: hypothetical protein DEP72_05930 [Clostridiales bacterium]|nr:hypothetical protein [Clostridiales bacterium]
MTIINNVELYHKGIHKKYSRLYIKLTIDNANFLEADIGQLLKTYFHENKQPFDISKTYEICLYPAYIKTECTDIEEILFQKAEQVRVDLESVGINIDIIYVFGNPASIYPKIVFEIQEQDIMREKNTFVLAAENYIYRKLINYYKVLLVNYYLKSNTLSKKEDKGYKKMKERYSEQPIASQDEVDKYYWVVSLVQDRNNYKIYNRRENEYISLGTEMVVISNYSKIVDDEQREKVIQAYLEYRNEELLKAYKSAREHLGYTLLCEVLDIAYTKKDEIIINTFVDQYSDFGSFSSEESKAAFNKLLAKAKDIGEKIDYILENGNDELIKKVNDRKISIKKAYELLS